MENISAVQFLNWSSEDFTWTWNSIPRTFKAGEAVYLDKGLADHFAKHLVDRELNKLGIRTNDPMRLEMEAKCFGSVVTSTPEYLASDLANLNNPKKEVVQSLSSELPATVAPKPRFCDLCESKGVRHLKGCPKYVPILNQKGKIAEPVTPTNE